MKCHQVLTGACNPGDKTFAVGSVEGVRLIAYAAGCNITVLSSTFHRVQIIPGICHNNIQITCVDVSNDTGKIAVAYENKVCVFEPTPLLTRNSKHGLDYWWVKTGQLDLDYRVVGLAWNHEGTRLLSAGDSLQMWRFVERGGPPTKTKFEIGALDEEEGHQKQDACGRASSGGSWEPIWRVRPPNPIVFLAFSVDGTLFATAGRHDRLVRIWYQNQQLLLANTTFQLEEGRETYGFIYVAHPRPVTGFSWRDTSRYMPRCAVANMLVTNCEDNISRLWCETVLPDDGLISLQQLDPEATQDPHFRAHRQKQRFIERLKHMRQNFVSRRQQEQQQQQPEAVPAPLLPLSSAYSVHDFHNFSVQGEAISPGMHFHLAATINAATDIPLVPAINASPDAGGVVHKFSLHWLNNKEIYFSMEAEKILQELAKVALRREDSGVERELMSGEITGAGGGGGGRGAAADHLQQQTPQHPLWRNPRLPDTSSPVRSLHPREGLAGTPSDGIQPSGGLSHAHSVTSFNTDISQPSTASGHTLTLSEALDMRIENLLHHWHQSPDLLFSVHPVDGSLLVWVADFLDEYQPGAFRQAQVSFSSRIPNAIPIGDASTMSSNVSIFNTKHLLNINELIKEFVEEEERQEAMSPTEARQDFKEKLAAFTQRYDVSHLVSMISKHENGTLNLWDVTFSPDSKFCQLLTISHRVRVNGHRFRVNDVTSHPVLPLLLTTSHHNMAATPTWAGPSHSGGDNFCSELILWRVDPISPIALPGSGGISELARINSRSVSAFTNVAWIPTLLPSTVLGNLSNSPSACFVSSDGKSLRVYQAVIDARSLLAELNSFSKGQKSKFKSNLSMTSLSPGREKRDYTSIHSSIVSAQSSARPGVVIELDQIRNAQQDWQNTILLHTFHFEMIHGSTCTQSGGRLGLIPSSMSAMVDLRSQAAAGFKEIFYVVLAEKLEDSTLMHMWQLIISSSGTAHHEPAGSSATSRSATPDKDSSAKLPKEEQQRVVVTSSKVCSQRLPLPSGVSVIQFVPAAGHLSSSSIYPACLAPYLLVTASTDNTIRFWTAVDKSEGRHEDFAWEEWRMETENDGSSAIQVPGCPLSVSAAYTGRIAVAYRSGQSFSRKHGGGGGGENDTCYVNLFVAIYECESSGGIEWILEDKIVLKNIEVPRVAPALDPSVLGGSGLEQDRRSSAYAKLQKKLYEGSKMDGAAGTGGSNDEAGGGWKTSTTRMSRVPSQATLSKLKEGLAADLPSHNLVQKQLVQLDWVSNEDGSHILTVSVANKVMLLTTVSSEISEACKATLKEKKSSTVRPLLRKSSSIGLQPVLDELKWMIFRTVELQTADGLPPLPMSVSWARDGVLLCAMDNEVAVYGQWQQDPDSMAGKDKPLELTTNEVSDHRQLKEEDLLSIVNESQMKPLKVGLKLKSGLDLAQSEERLRQMVGTGHLTEEDFMPGMGLFEASHLACPVLPQYHPKQLMELLNSGKIKWVKAILNHLVQCISPRSRNENSFSGGMDIERNTSRDWTKSRTLSLSVGPSGSSPSPSGEHKKNSTSAMPEELTLDYAQILAVPPMPLWMLLEADKEKPKSAKENQQEYNELFSESVETEVMNFDIIIEDEDSNRRSRRPSMCAEKPGLSFFGPRQARVLSKLLTHCQLPGLTSLDQMHLMALADTVASCNVDIAERLAIDAAITAMSKETMSGAPGADLSLDSVDDCGLRFLLAMKHHCYLQKCLPLSQRALIAKQGLATSNIIWGFHSDSEEELVSMIPSVGKNAPTWPELRELGVVWWVRSNAILRKLVEAMARTAFQNSQEPLDAALYYLAIKKKSMVWGLYRSIRDEKMTQFFKNDFNEERWRKAALKNAFALLGKQRFHHAAAFFLLSGSLKDAMEIILSKLEDLQLAILIGRLYDGATENYPVCVQNMLKTHVLGFNHNDEVDLSQANPDPFLRSIGHWILKDYEASLTTLLQRNVGHDHPSYANEESILLGSKKSEADPLVFNFYVFLRTHPLIIRQRLARQSEDRNKTLMLQGFKMASFDKGTAQAEDSVTPLERKLFFSTASFHLRGGCPALALEVLSKLPAILVSETAASASSAKKGGHAKPVDRSLMETGRLDETAVDWSRLGRVSPPTSSATPAAAQSDAATGLLDWGTSVSDKLMVPEEDELKLEWSEDEEEEDDDDDKKEEKNGNVKSLATGGNSFSLADDAGGGGAADSSAVENLDIIAQQMKFTACLKIMMEELSTLATGFEQEGGLIRCQLYIWLEREVDALKKLCNYNVAEMLAEPEATVEASTTSSTAPGSAMVPGDLDGSQPSGENVPWLHEVILSENHDFETRQLRASRRKKWLAANQPLLRTLLSYCSLHGANGGGLVNVRLELVLLLQELQQEQTPHQLLSPLPFPTTLPLLSACIAQQKTVVTDPVHYLQAFSHDILYQICYHKSLPAPGSAKYNTIFLVRDLAVSLSSCVYQSLCDSDTMSRGKPVAVEIAAASGGEARLSLSAALNDSYLILPSSARRVSTATEDAAVVVTTEPSKWPGVTSLRALLDRDKDDDTPDLTVLLCEAYVAIYMSLLVSGISTCDSGLLYRLVSQRPSRAAWAAMFGGGTKRQLRVDTLAAVTSPLIKDGAVSGNNTGDGSDNLLSNSLNTVTNMTKQRIKLNMKLLNVQLGSSPSAAAADGGVADNSFNSGSMPTAERRLAVREEFVPPEASILTKVLSKPTLEPELADVDYDSGAESDLEEDLDDYDDDDDPFSMAPPRSENVEHSDPNSYAWAILRLAVIYMAQKNVEQFLSIAGIEMSELPIASSLIYKCLRISEKWSKMVIERLNRDGKPPDNFIVGCFPDSAASGALINKYRSMLEPQNTPFAAKGHGLGPIKRLWRYLVHQERVQPIFIRYIFGKSRKTLDTTTQVAKSGGGGVNAEDSVSRADEPLQEEAGGQLRIIHKDQDNLTAYCMNRVSRGLVAVSTPREILEVNMSLLLHPSAWSDRADDEAERDILHMQETPPYVAPQSEVFSFGFGSGGSSSIVTSPSSQQFSQASQSGSGASRNAQVVKRHKWDGVRRLCAHPHLPLYISGGQDGAVLLWEWSHTHQVATARQPGVYAKVNKIVFSQQGNKFGVCDGDGQLSLWQAGHVTQPYFALQLHNKNCADFVFQGGSSSLLASAGHASDGRNVSLWDTLLSPKRACVQSFNCHEAGAVSLVHASQHQLLISAGKKGLVCFWDLRQSKLLHSFRAHDQAVKCMAISDTGDMLVTGSADGDIKIFDIAHHKVLHSFHGEHARHGLFKNMSQGVAQVSLTGPLLYSCGADGTFKMRKLPDREIYTSAL